MNVDLALRRLTLTCLVLLVAGAVLFVAALAAGRTVPAFVLPLGLTLLIVALLLRGVVLVVRIRDFLQGRPRRRRTIVAPPTYTCHRCGYDLRGVEGICCPECGTVRPAPIEGDEPDA